MKPLIEPDETIEQTVDGALFKVKSGKGITEKHMWIAGMATQDGQIVRCVVYYNPWTGAALE